MPFYRFEGMKSYRFNPHLSTADGPVIEGTHIAFGFVESPPGHVAEKKRSSHEMFLYVIRGAMGAQVGRNKQKVEAGDVIHVPRGAPYRWIVGKGGAVRYAAVRSTPRLEAAIGKHGAADNWRG